VRIPWFRKEVTAPPARARRTWRKVAVSAIALGMMVGASVALAAPAHAMGNGTETTIWSWHNGTCLDSNANGAVYLNPCWNNDAYQQWIFWEDTAGDFGIQDDATGRCLGAGADGSVSTYPEAECSFSNTWALWAVSDYIDGLGHHVINLANYGASGCLDANKPGSLPYINHDCYTGGYQDWKPED
jgi:hypothetical protein